MVNHLNRVVLPRTNHLLEEELKRLGFGEFSEPDDTPLPSEFASLDSEFEKTVSAVSQAFSTQAPTELGHAVRAIQKPEQGDL